MAGNRGAAEPTNRTRFDALRGFVEWIAQIYGQIHDVPRSKPGGCFSHLGMLLFSDLDTTARISRGAWGRKE